MADVSGTNLADLIDSNDGVTNGADMISGLSGDDTIYAMGGDDTIFGGSGNDWIHGGFGADAISGGTGIDRAYYWDSDAGVTVNLYTGEGFGGSAEGDTLIGVESLLGSLHNDILIGSDDENELFGYCGNDTLKGAGGDDVIHGEAHNDEIRGGGGADSIWGDDGIDTASYIDSPAGVMVLLYSGDADGGDAEGDVLHDIENLTGSGYADTLWGDDGVNALSGAGGNDTLKGYGGADSLSGGSGDDVLAGDTGQDTLTGNSGADRFVWSDTDETGVTTASADAVLDFSFAQGDRIDLSAIDADVYSRNDQDFTFIGTAAFSGAAGEVRYFQSGGNTYIELQTGTSTDVEGVIRLAGLHTPDASWFVL